MKHVLFNTSYKFFSFPFESTQKLTININLKLFDPVHKASKTNSRGGGKHLVNKHGNLAVPAVLL